jgi:hypothetical protein
MGRKACGGEAFTGYVDFIVFADDAVVSLWVNVNEQGRRQLPVSDCCSVQYLRPQATVAVELQVSIGFAEACMVMGHQLEACGVVGPAVLEGMQDAMNALSDVLEGLEEGRRPRGGGG